MVRTLLRLDGRGSAFWAFESMSEVRELHGRDGGKQFRAIMAPPVCPDACTQCDPLHADHGTMCCCPGTAELLLPSCYPIYIPIAPDDSCINCVAQEQSPCRWRSPLSLLKATSKPRPVIRRPFAAVSGSRWHQRIDLCMIGVEATTR